MKIFLKYTVFAVNLRQFQNGEIQSLNQQNYVFLNLGKRLKVADTIFVVADLFPFFAFVLELCLWLEQLIQFMPQPKGSIFSCGNASPYLVPGPGYRVYYIYTYRQISFLVGLSPCSLVSLICTSETMMCISCLHHGGSSYGVC